jgi:hypothetical protein
MDTLNAANTIALIISLAVILIPIVLWAYSTAKSGRDAMRPGRKRPRYPEDK